MRWMRWMPNPSRTAPDDTPEEAQKEKPSGIGIRGAPCPAPIPQKPAVDPAPPQKLHRKVPSRPLQRSGCAEHANLHLTSHLRPAVNAQPVHFATHFPSLALPLGQTNNQNSTCHIHARQQGNSLSRNVQPGRQVLCTRANTRCSGGGPCSPDQRGREQDRQACSMLAAKTTTCLRSTREPESVRRAFFRLRGFPAVCCRTADPVIASAMHVSQHPFSDISPSPQTEIPQQFDPSTAPYTPTQPIHAALVLVASHSAKTIPLALLTHQPHTFRKPMQCGSHNILLSQPTKPSKSNASSIKIRAVH